MRRGQSLRLSLHPAGLPTARTTPRSPWAPRRRRIDDPVPLEYVPQHRGGEIGADPAQTIEHRSPPARKQLGHEPFIAATVTKRDERIGASLNM